MLGKGKLGLDPGQAEHADRCVEGCYVLTWLMGLLPKGELPGSPAKV